MSKFDSFMIAENLSNVLELARKYRATQEYAEKFSAPQKTEFELSIHSVSNLTSDLETERVSVVKTK